MCVVAPAGWGKTTALEGAVRHNREVRRGVDVMVTVDPATGPVDLLEMLAGACDQPFDGVRDVRSWVAARAPQQVSFLFDDAHLLGATDTLCELIRSAPDNAHFVLAGREAVIDTDAPTIGKDDLAFDRSELDSLAAHTSTEPTSLDGLGAWPLAIDVATNTGVASGVGETIVEQLLAALDEATRRAVEVLAVVGWADDEMLRALGIGRTARELANELPLLRYDGSVVRAHDLLRQSRSPEPSVANELRRDVARIQVGREDREAAAALLAAADEWEDALDVLGEAPLGVLGARDLTLARWWTDRIPVELADHPTACLFRAIVARRQDPSQPSVRSELDRAAAGFRARQLPRGELAALTMLGYIHANVTGETEQVLAVHARVVELERGGCVAARGLALLGDGVMSLHTGEYREAVASLDQIPAASLTPEWQGIADWHHAMALIGLGRPDEATSLLADSTAPAPYEQDGVIDVMARFVAGDPADAAARIAAKLVDADRLPPRARVDIGLRGLEVLAAVGDSALTDRARRLVVDHMGVDDERVRSILTLNDLHRVIENGAEGEAAQALRTRFPHGFTGHADQLTVRRHLGPAYVLLPDHRAELDELDLPGTWPRSRQIARCFVSARDGEVGAVDVPTDVGLTVSVLGLRWATELATRLHAHDSPDAGVLTNGLLETFPRAFIEQVLKLQSSDDTVLAEAATSLSGSLPRPPARPVRIELLGPARLWRGGDLADDRDWRRERVRALLALLVVHGSIGRERAAALLWPDLEPQKSSANLRVTLSYLQNVLDPERTPNLPAWIVRTRGSTLVLHRDEYVDVDVMAFEELGHHAERLEVEGDVYGSLDYRMQAIGLWRGDPFQDTAYEDWIQPEIVRLRHALLRHLIRSAELLPTVGRVEEAIQLAGRALAVEPTAENASRALVAAHLARSDIGSARAAYRACLDSLRDLGLTPEPSTLEQGHRLGLR